MVNGHHNRGSRNILGASNQWDAMNGEFISLEDFISNQALNQMSMEAEQVLPSAKAKEYSRALADFRQADDEDAFVPVDANSFGQTFSFGQKLGDQAKAVGSKAVPTNVFSDAMQGSSHNVFGNKCVSGSNISLLDNKISDSAHPPAFKSWNYSSVAKFNPLSSQAQQSQDDSQQYEEQMTRGKNDGNNNAVDNARFFPRSATSQIVPPSASPANRVRTMNGSSVVNGINLANLKFVKPAPQCYKWDDRRHQSEQPHCRLWHPRELCKYYPKCTLSAEVCGFGHPFCGEYCKCGPKKRSLQMNHRIAPLHLQEAKEYMKQNERSQWKNSQR